MPPIPELYTLYHGVDHVTCVYATHGIIFELIPSTYNTKVLKSFLYIKPGRS